MKTLWNMEDYFVDDGNIQNEWYTPSKYIEAARSVMGSIDLDPASCAMANETVNAGKYYTKKENGLEQDWYGNVWLNPPYGRIDNLRGASYQQQYIKKLVGNYKTGNISQAIVLTLGLSCLNEYYVPLWEYMMCFQKKIRFKRPDGSYSQFGFGSIFTYLGPHEQRFIDTFKQFGPIVRRVDN